MPLPAPPRPECACKLGRAPAARPKACEALGWPTPPPTNVIEASMILLARSPGSWLPQPPVSSLAFAKMSEARLSGSSSEMSREAPSMANSCTNKGAHWNWLRPAPLSCVRLVCCRNTLRLSPCCCRAITGLNVERLRVDFLGHTGSPPAASTVSLFPSRDPVATTRCRPTSSVVSSSMALRIISANSPSATLCMSSLLKVSVLNRFAIFWIRCMKALRASRARCDLLSRSVVIIFIKSYHSMARLFASSATSA
mmetsp:Transcript_16465/g.57574  ORF Transcript_16465/g.57574 Transcript_16465/m.57574 type:complete len:254 (-) Transcript_16465:1150-1911(-)